MKPFYDFPKLLANPTTIALPETVYDSIYISDFIAEHIQTEHQLERLMPFIERLHPVFQVVFLRTLLVKHHEWAMCPAVKNWVNNNYTHGNLIVVGLPEE